LPPADREAGADELVVAAQAIGDTLASSAFTDGGSAQWLGLSSQAGRNWSLGPLSPDLFNGVAGVALFLAELGRRCGSRRYTDLARHAAATVHSQLARNLLVVPDGMAGQPGLVYALCRLGLLLDEETMVDRAVTLCADLRRSPSNDANFDVVGGSAGTIAALRILHSMRPDGPAAEVIAAAAERLVAAAHRYPGGWGWLPASIADQGLASVPLAGFGHGNAGIAWSLGHAATLLGVQRYADLGRDATAYERGLFDPDRGAWRDLRLPDRAVGVSAWCHGSVGIGLARLDSCRTALGDDPGMAEDIDAALASARSDGFGMSHCLCHGDTGTIDLFLTAAAVLDQPPLRDEANRRARQVLRSIAAGGAICGVPFGNPTPSLMVGLAGIGYGLLRVATPHQVPSVLLLQPEGDAHARPA
jgi:type 2 lantibiotic biosynthesis protein LanM